MNSPFQAILKYKWYRYQKIEIPKRPAKWLTDRSIACRRHNFTKIINNLNEKLNIQNEEKNSIGIDYYGLLSNIKSFLFRVQHITKAHTGRDFDCSHLNFFLPGGKCSKTILSCNETNGHRTFEQILIQKSHHFLYQSNHFTETVLCDAQKCFRMNRTSIDKINLNRWSFRQHGISLFPCSCPFVHSVRFTMCAKGYTEPRRSSGNSFRPCCTCSLLATDFFFLIVNLLHHLWVNNTARGRCVNDDHQIVFDMEFGEHRITICYAFYAH